MAGAQAHPQGSGAASVAGRGFTHRATVPAPVEILAGRNYPHTHKFPLQDKVELHPAFRHWEKGNGLVFYLLTFTYLELKTLSVSETLGWRITGSCVTKVPHAPYIVFLVTHGVLPRQGSGRVCADQGAVPKE